MGYAKWDEIACGIGFGAAMLWVGLVRPHGGEACGMIGTFLLTGVILEMIGKFPRYWSRQFQWSPKS